MIIATVVAALAQCVAACDGTIGDVIEKPVIALSYKGGARRPPLPDPFLAVHADGLIRLKLEGKSVESRVDSKAVKDKLALAKRIGFFELKSAELTESVRQSILSSGKPLPRLLDQTTTCITIRDGDKSHKVEFYALADYAKRLPEHKDLQNLAKLANWLEAMANKLAQTIVNSDTSTER